MSDLVPQIITGLPASVKDSPRADFRPSEFDLAIATKGYRMFWQRAGLCPCVNNSQTDQPDPTCTLCKGDAYYYFLPDAALTAGATVDSAGNQITLNDSEDAVLIYALMTSMTQDTQVFEKFGEWVSGMSKVTVQHQNKLGYRDRLISVDSEMTWSQIVEFDGGSEIGIVGERNKTGLRYPYVSINQFRSLDTIYRADIDYRLTAGGTIEWITTLPTVNTRLSIHGTVRPIWIIVDHVNQYRDTQMKGSGGLKTQFHQKLPIQSAAKLDFLINA